jgi:hypothetical protein
MAMNLIPDDSPDCLFGKACLIGDIWFFERFKFLSGGLNSVIGSLSIEIQFTTVIVERPQR